MSDKMYDITSKTKLTFEQANKKLEETVKMLESGKLDLQESMKIYEEACVLLNFCYKELDKCKGQMHDINERIQKLENTDNIDGELFND